MINGVNNVSKFREFNFQNWVRVFAHIFYEQQHSQPWKLCFFLEILRKILWD